MTITINAQFFAILILIIILIFYIIIIGRLWFRALVSGVKISNFDILMMYIRKVPASKTIDLLVKAAKNGVPISNTFLQLHHLAGGNPENLANGLIYAKQKNIKIDYEEAAKIELDGQDLVKYLQNLV